MSRRTLVILGLFFFMSACSSVQKWEKNFGGTGSDYAYSVQQTRDRGYIIAGVTNSTGAGGYDVYLIKTDSAGKETWEKTFGGTADDYAISVQQTSDGGYILAGVTDSMGAGSRDVYLIRTDSSGKKTWEKTFGGTSSDYAISVQQTSDGGYILAGVTDSMGAGSRDAYLIKTDSSGRKIWEKSFAITGDYGSDYAISVRQTSDNGYIIAGNTYLMMGDSRFAYLIKTDSSGRKIWERTFNGTDSANSVQQTGDGGYVIAGGTSSIESDSSDIYIIKTDSSGNRLWERTFGRKNMDHAISVQQTGDGGYIIVGVTNSMGAGSSDAYLIKMDSSGNRLWEKTFGGTADDYAYSVQQTTDGGYILAGKTRSMGAGNYDVYLIKTDSSGNSK